MPNFKHNSNGKHFNFDEIFVHFKEFLVLAVYKSIYYNIFGNHNYKSHVD